MQATQVLIEETAVAEFNAGFSGAVVRPGDEGYDAARAVFNGMYDRRPALIARCSGVADVIAALELARESGLEVAVRGGGHSVPGYSTCDDGIVIDLTGMKGDHDPVVAGGVTGHAVAA